MSRLSRRIPARIETVTFRWIKREFLVYGDRYIAARKNIRKDRPDPMHRCWWCRRDFEHGEMMALAAREKGANVTLCQDCVAESEKQPHTENCA